MPAALNWLLRLLPTNPICMRLVQGGSRRLRHLYIRSAYLALMMAVLFFASVGSASSLRELASRGAEAFTLVSFGQVALICLLTPIFMAGAIAQEANPRTWEILLTTPLNSLQIVLGNLFGRLFFILALLFSTLPLFALTQYYGGVPGRSIFASYAIAATSSLIVAAVAVTLSVTRTAGKRAVFIFYIAVVLYLFVTAAADQWLRAPIGVGAQAAHTTLLTPLNPFLALEALLFTNRYVAWDLAGTDAGWLTRAWYSAPVATFNWICVLASLGLIVFSTIGVRAIGQRVGGLPWYRRVLGLPARNAAERAPRHVGTNPIVWREAVAKGNSPAAIIARWGFAPLAILAVLVAIILFHTQRIDGGDLRLIVLTLIGAQVVIIVLTALNLSATAVSKEREDGSLDIILTTPIQPGPYLAGKLRGLIQYLLPMILAPVLSLAVVALYVLAQGLGRTGGITMTGLRIGVTADTIDLPVILPEAAISLPLTLAPFIAFCVMIGLQWSIKSKGTIGSVVAATGVALAIAGVIGLCGYGAGTRIPVIGAVLTALNPLNVVVAAVFPETMIAGSLGDATSGRISVVIGAAIAAAVYTTIVVVMHSNMKRTFMFTVRRLSGTN